VRAFETAFHRFMASTHPEIGDEIVRSGVLSEETEARLKDAIQEFKATVTY